MNYLQRRYNIFIIWRYPLGYINAKNIKRQQINNFIKNKHHYIHTVFMKNRFLSISSDLSQDNKLIDLSHNNQLIDLSQDKLYDADTETDIIEIIRKSPDSIKQLSYKNIYDIPKDFSHAENEYGIFYTIIFYSKCVDKWLLKFGIIEKRCINNRFKEHVYKYNIIKQKDYPLIIIMLLAKYPNVKMLEDKVKKSLKIDKVIGITGISHIEQTYNLKDIEKIKEIVLSDKYILDILNFNNFKITDSNEIVKND